MLNRWGILLGNQMIFSTADEEVARRYMTIGQGFRVFDHSTGYYVYMEAARADSYDLLQGEVALE